MQQQAGSARKPLAPARPPVVSFVGRSNGGKTALLEGLVPILKGRGFALGVIKHSVQPIGADTARKDTSRLYEAGADRVALVSPVQIAVFERAKEETAPQAVIGRFFSDMDLVLTEGFKKAPFPKIEVARRALSTTLSCGPGDGLIAVVADFDPHVPVRRFDHNDLELVADFLEETVMSGAEASAWKVELRVDGKEIPVKEFVADVIAGVVRGVVEPLKGVPGDPALIEIAVRKG